MSRRDRGKSRGGGGGGGGVPKVPAAKPGASKAAALTTRVEVRPQKAAEAKPPQPVDRPSSPPAKTQPDVQKPIAPPADVPLTSDEMRALDDLRGPGEPRAEDDQRVSDEPDRPPMQES